MGYSDANREIGRCNSRRRLSTGKTVSSNSNNNNNNNNDNVQRLNIDGFFFDSSAVASMLRGDGENQQRYKSREMIFRNISIDATVLEGARDLLRQRSTSTIVHRNDKENDQLAIINTDVDIIHCSGLVSELIRIVLPTTRRFGFAGNIPIAHNLDTVGLGIIGENLEKTAHNNNSNSNTDGDPGDKDDNKTGLKSLVLKGTRLESSGFRRFCDGLGVNNTLEELQMSSCILEEDDVLLLALALRSNRSIKSVFFANCKFGTKTKALQNGRPLETTQSINNTYPQINLPMVLEALIGHPTLESLKIYDMVCNERAIEALGKIVGEQGSKLHTLGLKNNLSNPRSTLPGVSQHLLPALLQNCNLVYLKLSGNNLNDEHTIELGRMLTESRTSIQTLSISDNLISRGLLPLASHLSDAKTLKWLDVLRNPIKKQVKKAMVSALKTNVQLERLDLDGSWDDEKFWWLSLNRGGRRALQAKNIPSSLWPTILERAYNVPMRRNSKQPSSTTNVSVAYYMIRRIPWLFEKASTSKQDTGKQESRPEQKRQRSVKDISRESEPKAKRMFNT
mmetsp:Transcript_10602/g.26759  ORF Transcript_10602/g.26759 Transcript_10602/m.26759 type:complete len:565 (+) Transcript_10602:164-1858(+)